MSTTEEYVGRAFPPRSLADIVGHDATVREVRRRFATSNHEKAMLLYGPNGVGKRTIARMYAKALFCESLRSDRDLPCGHCFSCQNFDRGHLGLMEFDARSVVDHREFRQRLDEPWLTDRRVLIIENVDEGSPEFMDALLKPMEEREDGELDSGGEDTALKAVRERNPPTTFILLASDLDGVRTAGQSRSTVHRLRRLTDVKMRVLCLRAFRQFGIQCQSEAAFKALVATCEGIPARVLEACCSLGNGAVLDAFSVRKLVDADQTDRVLEYWAAIFGQDEPRQDQLGLPAGASGSLHVAKSRGVLVEFMKIVGLAQQRVSTVTPPLSDKGDEMQRLVGLLRAHSEERGIPVSKLLTALSELYLREDYDDPAGFHWLGLQARRLVAGPAPKGLSPA